MSRLSKDQVRNIQNNILFAPVEEAIMWLSVNGIAVRVLSKDGKSTFPQPSTNSMRINIGTKEGFVVTIYGVG